MYIIPANTWSLWYSDCIVKATIESSEALYLIRGITDDLNLHLRRIFKNPKDRSSLSISGNTLTVPIIRNEIQIKDIDLSYPKAGYVQGKDSAFYFDRRTTGSNKYKRGLYLGDIGSMVNYDLYSLYNRQYYTLNQAMDMLQNEYYSVALSPHIALHSARELFVFHYINARVGFYKDNEIKPCRTPAQKYICNHIARVLDINIGSSITQERIPDPPPKPTFDTGNFADILFQSTTGTR